MPPSYIRDRAVVWAYGRGQTDTQTRVITIHFASSTTHAKCKKFNCDEQDVVHGLSNEPSTKVLRRL